LLKRKKKAAFKDAKKAPAEGARAAKRLFCADKKKTSIYSK